MEARTKSVPNPNYAPSGDIAELDYSPKKMTLRETLTVSLKLALAAGAFLGLLWLAHIKLEK